MKTFKKIGTFLFIFSFIVLPVFAYAQGTLPNNPSQPSGPTQTGGISGTGGTINIPNPLRDGTNNLMSLIVTILNKIVMPIAAIAVVVFIIYAGFTYVLAQGNPVEIKKAHDRLLYGLIGAGIVLGAVGISKV